ncbi:conserved hypothetical protein [Gloeothece citriformis PCC 7424]|uniref:PIN domain-containing protein n=1 Tax=Gloeothece citriformis (strain PCC 7424) TaxID=65393 RepID=B7K7K0_GLOC7|nr:hypothetical protein [Gloeothece citriformis]ACK69768.1 conserved hypothetical protein [Gloeothece citriformis PCC 7424]
MIVILDSSVLGMVINPNIEQINQCEEWFYSLLARGITVYSSDICDYEVRRSLILDKINRNKLTSKGIEKLNDLRDTITFLPLTSTLMLEAAECWAEVRRQGLPTADEKNIDADMIICAQWRLLKKEYPNRTIIIATTNIRHLNILAEAEKWENIRV